MIRDYTNDEGRFIIRSHDDVINPEWDTSFDDKNFYLRYIRRYKNIQYVVFFTNDTVLEWCQENLPNTKIIPERKDKLKKENYQHAVFFLDDADLMLFRIRWN